MFTYSFHEGTRAATISVGEGLKTRGFATLLFEGFNLNGSNQKLNIGLMQDFLPPHIRNKHQDSINRLTKDDSTVRARAHAFCTILCHMLNDPNEPVEERADTRYSYNEEVDSTNTPHFPNPASSKRDIMRDICGGVSFKIQRYAGIVNSSEFVEVNVWPCDADRFRAALEKTLYSMVDVDAPDRSSDFRPSITAPALKK